jgi:hypothetical protein
MIIYEEIIPEFPSTRHLPHKPNATRGDSIATTVEVKIIFQSDNVFLEEKIDGASLGITVIDGHPLIRNRNHVLNKGHQAKTAAKMQFSNVWGWYYKHQRLFQNLIDLLGPVSVYGEWLWAKHTVEYDQLPAYFVPYDIFEHDRRIYLATEIVRDSLERVGFATVPLLHHGKIESYEQLEDLTNQKSEFSSTAIREGVYLKVSDGEKVAHRFKMVRQGFIPGEHWSNKQITRNKLCR